MPVNPDMATVMSQMMQMQSAQSASTNMLASAIGSLQQTISQMASATQLGVSTALAGGQTALQSLQLGAATAMGDIGAVGGGIGQALQMMGGPAGAPPPVPAMAMGGGAGGMTLGPGNMAYGASVGAMALVGAAGGFAAWEMTSPTLGAGLRAVGQGARVGARLLGGVGIRGAIGGAIGGGAVAMGAIALPLAAGLGVEEAVNIGIERIGAVRDVEAILAQQAGRITAFDPNIGIPSAGQFRGAANQIVGDLARTNLGAGGAAQFVSQAAELGLFTGAGADPQGIRGRAQELASAVNEMTRLLGTSMEESLTMMAELRQVGFEGAGAPGAVLASRGRGRLGGFTAAEMHTVGMRGAQAFRGMGISPTVGFNAAQSNLAQISDMVNNNLLSNDLVASMGGRQRMAEAATQGMAGFLQTGAGQAFLAAGAQGPGGVMGFIGGQQDLATAAMMGLGGGGDPRDITAFLGARGRIARELGPEMIAAGQMVTLQEMVERSGYQLRGLNRQGQQDLIAGIALRGQQGLGIQGQEQAVLLAARFMAAPETLTRQAQAMRSESWREALTQYNDQNVNFSGAWFKTTTFFNELGAGIGRPFAAVRNAIATAYDDFTEDTGMWLNGEGVEILTKGNVETVAKFQRDLDRDPRAQERAIQAILSPDDVERLRKRANVVTLSGTMTEIHEQIKAKGLIALGGAEETFLSKAAAFGRPDLPSAAIEELDATREFTISAIKSTEVETRNRLSNEVSAARIRRAGATEKSKKADERAVDEMLHKNIQLSRHEEIMLGLRTETWVAGGVGAPGVSVVGKIDPEKDPSRQSIAFINDTTKDEGTRADWAIEHARRVSGGDEEQMALFLTSEMVPQNIQAIVAERTNIETLRRGLQSDPEKLSRQFKESARGLSETLLGGTSNKEIRFIQSQMDLVSLLTDSNTSHRVAAEAANEFAKRGRRVGLEINAGRVIGRAQQVEREARREFRAFGGETGLVAMRRRIAVGAEREVESLEERILRRGEQGIAVAGEAEAFKVAERIAAVGGEFEDVNQIVDNLSSEQQSNLLRITDRSPVMRQLIQTAIDSDRQDEQAIKKTVGLVAGVQRVKTDPADQARVEAFQSETIKGFNGINQTISDNLALSSALLNDAQRLGIQVSRGK